MSVFIHRCLPCLGILSAFLSANAYAGLLIGGSLTGLLSGGSITLQNNSGDDLVLSSDGSFSFATPLNDGQNYSISISTQPPGQACAVTNAQGTVSGSDITNVSVSCSNTPCLAIDRDDVFVVSFSTGELIRYKASDPANTKTILLPGGALVSPESIVIGSDCNLYIGESGDGASFAPRVSRYEVDTLTLSTVYPFGAFDVFPASLVFRGDDLLIGRSPFYGNTGSVVKLGNATGGALSVSDYTSGSSLASSPGMALDEAGRLYVSDHTYDFGTQIASGPVKRFDSSGNFGEELIADGASGLAGPTGLTVFDNALYTVNAMSGDVLKTDLSTDITSTFYSAALGPSVRYTIASLVDGSMLVGKDDGSIHRIGSDGSLVSTFVLGIGEISGIATVTGSSLLSLYQVGGTVTGLASGKTVVLQNNAGDNLELAANGSFVFNTQLSNAAVYDVTVLTQPIDQRCVVSNAAGSVNSKNVNNVAVACVNTYSIGGQVTGLLPNRQLVLQNNAGDDLAVSIGGVFSFMTSLPDGATYSVTIKTQPAGQTCSISSNVGAVSSANVTDVSIDCAVLPIVFKDRFSN